MLRPRQPYIEGYGKIFDIQSTWDLCVVYKDIRAMYKTEGECGISGFGLIYFKSPVSVPWRFCVATVQFFFFYK